MRPGNVIVQVVLNLLGLQAGPPRASPKPKSKCDLVSCFQVALNLLGLQAGPPRASPKPKIKCHLECYFPGLLSTSQLATRSSEQLLKSNFWKAKILSWKKRIVFFWKIFRTRNRIFFYIRFSSSRGRRLLLLEEEDLLLLEVEYLRLEKECLLLDEEDLLLLPPEGEDLLLEVEEGFCLRKGKSLFLVFWLFLAVFSCFWLFLVVLRCIF